MTETNIEGSKLVLDEIGYILDLSKENGIDTRFFEKAKDHLAFIAEKLHVSELQAALFCHIFDSGILNPERHKEDCSLISSLQCTKCEYLKYLNEIDELVRMNYVNRIMDRKNLSRYTIPREKQFSDFSDFSDKGISDYFIFKLKKDEHILQKLELIEHTNDNGFCDKEEFCLTDKAIDELLSEVKTDIMPNKKEFMLSSGIKEKQMFYNYKENEQINKLIDLLLPENFKGIQERLAGQGLRKGFACLFSGEPGTGKTETVYHIEKKQDGIYYRLTLPK